MFDEDRRLYTIKDIYAQNISENKPMLSAYAGDFWAGYVQNSAYFDRRFKKLYTSWFPFDQEAEEGRQAVADEFRADVYAHLLANDKRYSELFRINTIPDESYDLLNNYDMTETYTGSGHREGQNVKGQQTNTEAHNDIYGQQNVNRSNTTTYGQHIIEQDTDTAYGAQGTDTVNSTSAYNETGYTATDKTETDTDAHRDITNSYTNDGTHTDMSGGVDTYGSHTDIKNADYTEGMRTDTNQEDSTDGHTLHRVGNIGVQTATDMMQKAVEFWDLFSFYDFIFKEIARDLLRGVM